MPHIAQSTQGVCHTIDRARGMAIRHKFWCFDTSCLCAERTKERIELTIDKENWPKTYLKRPCERLHSFIIHLEFKIASRMRLIRYVLTDDIDAYYAKEENDLWWNAIVWTLMNDRRIPSGRLYRRQRRIELRDWSLCVGTRFFDALKMQ